MEKATTNPLFVVLFFFIRCILPLMIMLGISYLLKKLGLISERPDQPEHPDSTSNPPNNQQGGLAHGKS